MSSPSRPASQAFTIRSTSSRLISLWTAVSCLRDFSSFGTSLNFSGRIGRSAKRHFLSLGSYSSGGASPTRWPTAHVITYSSPSRYVFSFDGLYEPGSAAARSRPTEGFSAMTSVLLMGGLRPYAPASTYVYRTREAESRKQKAEERGPC